MDPLVLCLAFFVIATLYASAGFGGGSSYLAVLALFGVAPAVMRPLALLCNLAVTGWSSAAFARARVTPWSRALPLIAASVPAAFLGGRVTLPQEHYLLLLGGLLMVAATLMLFGNSVTLSGGAAGEKTAARYGVALSLAIGAGVGFASGVVGIGGGIFLSPVLFLTRWAAARAIAATTSLFIALNSAAGLAGQLSVGLQLEYRLSALLLLAVVAGGALGTRLSLRSFTPATIRKLAAALILLVGVRLVVSNWHILTLP